MPGRFTYKGETFEEIKRYTFAETSWIESTFQCDISGLHETQDLMATIFLAIKRAKPGTLKWDEFLALGPDDFEFLGTEPEIVAPAQPVPPEETWDVDPTGAVILTADQFASDLTSQKRGPISSQS